MRSTLARFSSISTPLECLLTMPSLRSFTLGKSRHGFSQWIPSASEWTKRCHTSAVWSHALVGMHPTSRQVPPSRGCFSMSAVFNPYRSEEHTSELQSLRHLVCRLLLEKKTDGTPSPEPGRVSQLALGNASVGRKSGERGPKHRGDSSRRGFHLRLFFFFN